MGTRTVRLDDEAETALDAIRRESGMTISEALKKGLLVLRRELAEGRKTTAWDVYERLDLGPGGYARAPADRTRRAARDAIRRKHHR